MNGLEFAPLTGRGFSLAEKTAITASSSILLSETKQSRCKVWGKITGFKADYIVVQCLGQGSLSSPLTYYSVDGGCNYSLLEPMAMSDPRAAQCSQLKALYMGDPAYEYRLGEGDDVVALKESDRVAWFVGYHDYHCRVIPRGSQLRFEDGTVRLNPNFEGLDRASAGKLGSYLHLRKERSDISALELEGVSTNVDFLDPLTNDIPSHVWTLKHDPVTDVIYGMNLLILGSVFFHGPETNVFGNVYVGDGCVNNDLSFVM